MESLQIFCLRLWGLLPVEPCKCSRLEVKHGPLHLTRDLNALSSAILIHGVEHVLNTDMQLYLHAGPTSPLQEEH